jgi:hypothetical protein
MLFHHTEPVTYLRLQSNRHYDETALTQEQVAQNYMVFSKQ